MISCICLFVEHAVFANVFVCFCATQLSLPTIALLSFFVQYFRLLIEERWSPVSVFLTWKFLADPLCKAELNSRDSCFPLCRSCLHVAESDAQWQAVDWTRSV
jgi:hypothetical protein